MAPPSFQQRRSLVTLARILAAFAALGWRPAPLAAGVGRVIKLQPRALQRLPPWEVLLLLWAVARMRHPDQALLLQLQHRASQQVSTTHSCAAYGQQPVALCSIIALILLSSWACIGRPQANRSMLCKRLRAGMRLWHAGMVSLQLPPA